MEAFQLVINFIVQVVKGLVMALNSFSLGSFILFTFVLGSIVGIFAFFLRR